MRKVCIINQKGGVGKTTTTISLAAGLAQKKKKVLILDLDPQGNINTSFCMPAEKHMYHLLVEDADPRECIVRITDFLHIIPSDSSISKAEMIMIGQPSRETILRRAMAEVQDYDYIIVDCPPSINLLNQNALLYCNEAFIPVSTEYLSLDALRKMEATIDEINHLFNHNIHISMIIPTMYDKRIRSSIEVLRDIKKGYNGVVSPPIRVNSKLKEAPGESKTIYEYAKRSRGAEDYLKLTDRVIEREYFN